MKIFIMALSTFDNPIPDILLAKTNTMQEALIQAAKYWNLPIKLLLEHYQKTKNDKYFDAIVLNKNIGLCIVDIDTVAELNNG